MFSNDDLDVMQTFFTLVTCELFHHDDHAVAIDGVQNKSQQTKFGLPMLEAKSRDTET